MSGHYTVLVPRHRFAYYQVASEKGDPHGAMVVEVQDGGLVYIEHVHVDEQLRGRGIAGNLFDFMIGQLDEPIARVQAHLATSEADGLFDSLRRRYPDIEFDVD